MAADTFLIVGLGNPGPTYSDNRHNVGQMVADLLASRLGAKFKSHKAGAVIAEGRLGMGGPKVIVAKSTGFMNTSGRPVSGLVKFFDVPLGNLIVVYDELDIPAHDVRLKLGGGHAGHNGIRDIIAALGSPDFLRVRVGIGRPPGQQAVSDFVLSNFGTVERKELPVTLELAADACELLVSQGLGAAQQRFHGA